MFSTGIEENAFQISTLREFKECCDFLFCFFQVLHLLLRKPFHNFLTIKSNTPLDMVKGNSLLPTQFVNPDPGDLHHL
jgi:hypothetical protein